VWIKTVTEDDSDVWVFTYQLVAVTESICEDEADLVGIDTVGRLHTLRVGAPDVVRGERRNITET